MKKMDSLHIIVIVLVASVGIAYAVSGAGAGNTVNQMQLQSPTSQSTSTLESDDAQSTIIETKPINKNKKTFNVGRNRAENMLGK